MECPRHGSGECIPASLKAVWDESGSGASKTVIQTMMEILNLQNFDHISAQVCGCQKPGMTGSLPNKENQYSLSDNKARNVNL